MHACPNNVFRNGPDFAASTIWTFQQDGYPCYRVPNVINTGVALLAFAEARNWTGDGCIPPNFPNMPDGHRDLVMKVSRDRGRTWGPQQLMYEGGLNSAAVFDAVRQRAIVHLIGADGVTQLNCSADGAECEIASVAHFLGKYNHTSPGPGLGVQVRSDALCRSVPFAPPMRDAT